MSLKASLTFADVSMDTSNTPGNGKPLSRGLSFWAGKTLELPTTIKYLEDYDEKDFELPDEQLPDGRLTYHEQVVQQRQRARIKKAGIEVKDASRMCSKLESLYQDSIVFVDKEKKDRLYRNGASTNVLGRRGCRKVSEDRVKKEHVAEMALIHALVGKNPSSAHQLSKMTLEDFGDESTFDYPKLDSLEEACEDLRLEALESYYNSHGAKAAVKWSCSDRRKLRNWFKALDFDQSGEVSVYELQDPLISAGILKTRDQVFRVLLNADKNGTMGLDFKEFLDALHGNALAKSGQLVELQNIGSSESGLSMDTQITAERRKKLINSCVDQTEKRGYFFDKSFKSLAQATKSGTNSMLFSRARRRLGDLEGQHEYEKLLHNKYVNSLECVVQTKRSELVDRDNAILDASFQSRNSLPGARNTSQTTTLRSSDSSPKLLTPWEELRQQYQPQSNAGIDLGTNPYACYNGRVDPWSASSKISKGKWATKESR